MSLLGVDIGSSSVKVVAFGELGESLGTARESIPTLHPEPGRSEVDPRTVEHSVQRAIAAVANEPAVRKDRPQVIAISASGREVFPATQDGTPLGLCLRTDDSRGVNIEGRAHGMASEKEWLTRCGHVPDRSDPVNRVLWWYCCDPEVAAEAERFLGWHDFLTLRLCGRAVIDPSLAGGWLAYDLSLGGWNTERLAELEIKPELLPEIVQAGTAVDRIDEGVARYLGLSSEVVVVAGGYDVCCAAIGAGALEMGSAALVAGSWEDVVVLTTAPEPDKTLGERGVIFGPYLGEASFAFLALTPNGATALEWAASLAGLSPSSVDEVLATRGIAPSPVVAIPHLAGASVPWGRALGNRATITSLTLASSPIDILQAVLEGVGIEVALILELFRERGTRFDHLRAAGGGTNSSWWTQLKADLAGVTIEAANRTEAGALGAAMLASVAVGAHRSLVDASEALGPQTVLYEPNPHRAALYRERIDLYRDLVRELVILHEPTGRRD